MTLYGLGSASLRVDLAGKQRIPVDITSTFWRDVTSEGLVRATLGNSLV
jgi:hypothetical protein